MIIFEQISYKNFLATGDVPIVVDLNTHASTLIVGRNGAGKCVCINTPIRVRNRRTGEICTMTVGELYAQAQSNTATED
jgi:ABC-type branched-subunit amino acid transport system ATPase component